MSKVAIIYLATGRYIEFWKGYFDSYEEFFFPGWEKHYYVFTDQENIYQEDNPRVHKNYQGVYPWPITALLKFNIALQLEDELRNYDFVTQTNANLECVVPIYPEEIMPRKEMGEKVCCVIHPGVEWNHKKYSHKCYYEYDRNPKSRAYIPYNGGKYYVYSSGIGATGPDFVEWLHYIADAVVEDLKHNIIPKWHDESYVNQYAATHDDVRYLHSGYCYPVGFDISYEKKIAGRPKLTVFDVNDFKGYDTGKEMKPLGVRIKGKARFFFIDRLRPRLLFFRDNFLRK